MQMLNGFLLPFYKLMRSLRRFHGICLYDWFIYCLNFVFRKCLENRHHLGSGRKTVNSRGYSELRKPIKSGKKLLFTDLVNTNLDYSFGKRK